MNNVYLEDIIRNRIEERGLRSIFVSRETRIPPDKLSRSLSRKRIFKPEELISLCILLDLKLEDFSKCCAPPHLPRNNR